MNFPEMGDAYKQYREFVDAPFLPNDDKEMSQKNSKGLARELAAVVRELERIGAEVLKKGKAKK
ncbi:MAG: hypothetical protein KAH56_09660 [Candidatus Krumholzibacteria bacterium]|nr:hypothetical protein [Candidatus Krumholzibacteria bacterium]